MNIIDISFSKIELLQPKPINDQYIFDINYDSNTLTFQCAGIMKTKVTQQLLNITNKNDLLQIHKIYSYLIELIFNNQSKWFENEFTCDELKDMFVDIFIPNIEFNCLDMTCNMMRQTELQDSINIIPSLHFKNITFDGKKFKVSIDLEDYHIINNVENTLVNEDNNSTSEKQETLKTSNPQMNEQNIQSEQENDEENKIINEEKEGNHVDNEIEEQINEEEQDINQENTEENALPDEIELDTNNLEVLDLEVNEDDVYLIYKLIQNNIYKNMNENLRNIFESKNVDISKIDINELIYDSDDSDEENEEEEDFNKTKDDFESNFNKLL